MFAGNSAVSRCLLTGAITLVIGIPALAVDPHVAYRLKNGWLADQNGNRPPQYINMENGELNASPIKTGWLSAQWTIDTVSGPGNKEYHHIRNVFRPEECLHVEKGPLECGPIESGWQSALWELEVMPGPMYRLKNTWRPNTYINTQSGKLTAGPIQDGWLTRDGFSNRCNNRLSSAVERKSSDRNNGQRPVNQTPPSATGGSGERH